MCVVIVSKAILRDYVENRPEVKESLNTWYENVSKSNWKSFSEMKNSFNSVDAVGNDRYVFNLKGNQFRLIALIIFRVRTVFILFVGSHEEYDKVDATSITYKSRAK